MSFFGFKQTDRKIVNTWKICREISSTHEEQETCSPQPGRCSTLTIVMIVIIIIIITITIIIIIITVFHGQDACCWHRLANAFLRCWYPPGLNNGEWDFPVFRPFVCANIIVYTSGKPTSAYVYCDNLSFL